jgi:hypothetical protein
MSSSAGGFWQNEAKMTSYFNDSRIWNCFSSRAIAMMATMDRARAATSQRDARAAMPAY